MTDTFEQKAQDLAAIEQTIADLYKSRDALRYEIIGELREQYPAEWERVVERRQANSFTVGSVTIEMPSRAYDTGKLAKVLSEDEYATVVTTETKVVEKVDGRKMTAMWKDVSRVEALQTAVIPGVPKVKVKYD